MLSFKHEVFLEVARQLSFTKASQILYISQPAITKHIQQLEEQYNTSLFERKGNLISLTEAGQILLEFLQQAKSIQRQLEYEIHTYHNQHNAKGELKLGASTTVALYIIPSILSGFRQKYPGIHISLLNRNSENIMKALLEHEIDMGIIEGKNKISMVNSEPFLADEVIPVCSARSYLAKKIRYAVKDLTDMPVVLRERGSGTLSVVKQTLANHGIKLSDLKITMRLGGTEALKNFVLADDSLGFLSMKAVSKELASGEMVRLYIDGLTMVRQFYFIQRHGEDNQGLNQAFIKFSKSHYNIKL
ncbi:LysR substrate-binding domain-containing protein [Chryseosolibacter indicus]|uniref:LysR family transcriptional regulator n=1 Tax=Chryseosolibacter indicus TaxID=2782351 RepID=A0ABS5VYZ1_9BACT|nr:LysR substrate-binding domain-containing protein [Chryseosolibacter indicus]MBT1705979.1 LysR family transcriptional regulator [Chryseosolibacter indicus]